jgi:hypothetical protein
MERVRAAHPSAADTIAQEIKELARANPKWDAFMLLSKAVAKHRTTLDLIMRAELPTGKAKSDAAKKAETDKATGVANGSRANEGKPTFLTAAKGKGKPKMDGKGASSPETKGDAGGDGTCYRCGQPGHIRRYCPDKTQGHSDQGKTRDTNSDVGTRSAFVTKTRGGKGGGATPFPHKPSAVRALVGAPRRRELAASLGGAPLRATLDTGCDVDVAISRRAFEELEERGARFQSTGRVFSLKSAFGEEVEAEVYTGVLALGDTGAYRATADISVYDVDTNDLPLVGDSFLFKVGVDVYDFF